MDVFKDDISHLTIPQEPTPWIEWHLSQKGNEFLVDMEISFLMDPLNTVEFTEEDSPSVFP